jgi:hypothetical protein
MGRPIHKKYFGNRNIGVGGYQTTNSNAPAGDDRIGGEGIESYTLPVQLGNIEVDSNSGQPTLTIPAPQLPGGVPATATVVWEVASITITSTNDYGTSYVNGETVTFTGATGVTATVAVAADDIGVITPVLRGSFTTIPTSESYNIIGAVGNDAQAEITWRVKSITKLERGSGYTTAPTLSWAAGVAGAISGTPPGAPTAVLTTDSGAVGSATNQENAIVIRAKIDSEATVRIGDIIKQSSSRRYKVKTSDGTAVCKLVADDTPATFQAYVKATDDNGNTYYVTKITSHKALLTQWTQNGEATWLFATGDSAPWTFTSTANGRVIIENA